MTELEPLLERIEQLTTWYKERYVQEPAAAAPTAAFAALR